MPQLMIEIALWLVKFHSDILYLTTPTLYFKTPEGHNKHNLYSQRFSE